MASVFSRQSPIGSRQLAVFRICGFATLAAPRAESVANLQGRMRLEGVPHLQRRSVDKV